MTQSGTAVLTRSVGQHTVRLWGTTDPTHPDPLGAPLATRTDLVYSVAFTSDGRILAVAGQREAGGTVRNLSRSLRQVDD